MGGAICECVSAQASDCITAGLLWLEGCRPHLSNDKRLMRKNTCVHQLGKNENTSDQSSSRIMLLDINAADTGLIF